MSMGNGDILMIAFACIVAAAGCGSSQIKGEFSHESPMQCYKENVLKNDVSSVFVSAAVNTVFFAAGANPRITNLTLANNYYSWGQCLDMFSGLTTHEETETDDAVKYSWVPPHTKHLQISSFEMDQSDVRSGNAVIFEIVYQLKVPTDQKEIDVRQTRRLKFYDDKGKNYIEIGKVEKAFNLLPGKYRSDGFISVPEGLEEGRFMIDVEIAAYGISEHAEIPFVVVG